MNDSELILSIYSRPECHLCEEMIHALKKWQNQFNFQIKVINIDQDSSLVSRFAARIPLLAVDDVEICEYHLNETALLEYFENRK